jgi:serine/threonine protein kinase
LGEGGFGVVRRAKHTKTHDSFAVKIVDRTALVDGGEQALQDEIAALKILRGGPHIIRLFDVFKENQFTYLVMEEMVGGELLQRIVDKVVYTERDARSVCKILFSAMDYCHKKRIAHRDLKPENLLLSVRVHLWSAIVNERLNSHASRSVCLLWIGQE